MYANPAIWKNSQGYTVVNIGNRLVRLHRLIWEIHNGPIPHGYQIHHRNGNKQDNRLSNLQCVSRREHDELHKDDQRTLGKLMSLVRSRDAKGRWLKSEATKE
jgi:hypothetical protein